MNIRDGVTRLSLVVDQMIEDTFNACIRLITESVLLGSTLTGSQGVPVDTGAARNSILAEKLGKLRWRIAGTGFGKNEKTGKIEEVTYLVHIEENIRGVVFNTGGPHFFGKTIAGFPNIVAAAVAEVAA